MTLASRAASILGYNSSDRMRVAAELLIAGVAFRTSGTHWDVFSHDGDHIGELSTFYVCEATHALRSIGLRRTSITDVNAGEKESVTFGHHYPDGIELDAIMKRRGRSFSTIH